MTQAQAPHAAWGRGGKLVGTGYYQPERVVTNDDIANIVDTNDEWIRQRVGIETRRFVDEETVPDMAEAAVRMALSNAQVDPADVDLIIVATCTNLDRSPSAAGEVAGRLGFAGAAAFDLNAACSGFIHALALANQSLATGSAKTVVVVGAEAMTSITDWEDRATCILVGDGAGAFVLQASEQSHVSPAVWGTVPGMTDAVRVSGNPPVFEQDGRRVFRWAIGESIKYAQETLDVAGVTVADLTAFVPHQANLRIIEPLARKLNVDESQTVVAKDIVESGNTSAASIPLAVAKMRERGQLPTAGPALLFGFGGGFSYAGIVLELSS